MNRFFLTTLLISFYASSVSASEVTIPNTFSAGTKAVAAEVNDNFIAVKNAVDDNHQAINTNASDIADKQNRVTGSCRAGYYMTAVAEDGSVTCNPDDDSSLDTRITANANSIATKQNSMISGCAPGWYVRYVDSAGRVTCQRDTDTGAALTAGTGIELDGNTLSIESSTVSVNASAFKITRPFSCDVGMAVNSKIYVWDGDSCGYTNGAVFFAPVSLPQGVQITSYLCYVTDTTTEGQVYSTNLKRLDWNGTSFTVAGTGATGQTGMATTYPEVIPVGVASTRGYYVDNTSNSYYLSVHFQHSGNSGIDFGSERGDLILLGCKVSYIPD